LPHGFVREIIGELLEKLVREPTSEIVIESYLQTEKYTSNGGSECDGNTSSGSGRKHLAFSGYIIS
jgi:hypothetical protein